MNFFLLFYNKLRNRSMVTITLENFEENKWYVGAFLSVLNALTKNCCVTVFGGVVRDLIIPMSEVEMPKNNMKTFTKALVKNKQIELNDIDVLLTGKYDYEDDMEEIFTHLISSGISASRDPFQDREENHKDENFMIDEKYDFEVLRLKLYHEIFEEEIRVDFVKIAENSKIIPDFNVNNLTWNFNDGFRLIYDDTDGYNFFTTLEFMRCERIVDIKYHIKNKTCILNRRIISNEGTFEIKRILKMLNKGYTILGMESICRTSYKDVDIKDRKCLICFEELDEGVASVVLCKSHHFIHWECGSKWWKQNAFKCIVCKTVNAFESDVQ